MTSFILVAVTLLASYTSTVFALNFNEFKVLTTLPRGVLGSPRYRFEIFDQVTEYRVKVVKLSDVQSTELVPDEKVKVHIIGNDGRVWARRASHLGDVEPLSISTFEASDEILANSRSHYFLSKDSDDGYEITWRNPIDEDDFVVFRLDFSNSKYMNFSFASDLQPGQHAKFRFQEPEDVVTPSPTSAPTTRPSYAIPEPFTLRYGDTYALQKSTYEWVNGDDGLGYSKYRHDYSIRFLDPQDTSSRREIRSGDACFVEDSKGNYWLKGSGIVLLTTRRDDMDRKIWVIDDANSEGLGNVVKGPDFGLFQDNCILSSAGSTKVICDTVLGAQPGGPLSDVERSGFLLFPSENEFPTRMPTSKPTAPLPTLTPTKKPTGVPSTPMPTNFPTTPSPTYFPTTAATTTSPTTPGATFAPVHTAGPTDPEMKCQYLVGNGGCQSPQSRDRASPSKVYTTCIGDVPCDSVEVCYNGCLSLQQFDKDSCTGFSYSKTDKTCEIISGPIDPFHLYVPYNKPDDYEEVCFFCNHALLATQPPQPAATPVPTVIPEEENGRTCNYLKNDGACVTPDTEEVNEGMPFVCDTIDGKCTSEQCIEACKFKEGNCYGILFNPKEESCKLMETPIYADKVKPLPDAGFCAICTEELDVEESPDETSSASRGTLVSAFTIVPFAALSKYV